METIADLLSKLRTGEARVAVIGLGYVGLPLAISFAQAGYDVTGVDVDERRVETVNCGGSHVEDVDRHIVQELVHAQKLRATKDFSILKECDAISICVPTPLRKTGDPDISYIVSVTEELARNLRRGQVIVLESTTYPGTTTEVLLSRLSENEDGLHVGRDFFLAFSPERIDPGREDWTTHTTPKVIGGVTPSCLEVASAYYGKAINTLVPVSSAEAAEMVKLLENTFRSVNIGLANEVLLMCDRLNLNVWEVIEAAATKPFGFMKFTPGPGLGGHCIPIDPLYLSWKLKTLNYNARFIELASEVNTAMPRYWVQKVQDALNEEGKALNGSQILLLGVAYKKNISDVRESPSLDIIHLLRAKGAHVKYHDPHVPAFDCEGVAMKCEPDLEGTLQNSDCVVIVTDHDDYDWQQVEQLTPLVVDARNALGKIARSDDKRR